MINLLIVIYNNNYSNCLYYKRCYPFLQTLLCFYHLNPCGCESIAAPSILLHALLETREHSSLAEATYSYTDAFALQRAEIHPDTFGCVTR